MNQLFALITAFAASIGGQVPQRPEPTPVPIVAPAPPPTTPAPTEAPQPTKAPESPPPSTVRTVNDLHCPENLVAQITLFQGTYPMCGQPPTESAEWACIHYLPGDQWTVTVLPDQSDPGTTECADDGNIGRVEP